MFLLNITIILVENMYYQNPDPINIRHRNPDLIEIHHHHNLNHTNIHHNLNNYQWIIYH